MTQQATMELSSLMVPLDEEGDEVFYGLSVTAWIKIAIVAMLMAATFRFNLLRLWLKTNPFSGEPNWRHAICVPLIGIYYLFVHRDELLETKVGTAWGGLGILLLGILIFTYGVYPGQNDFVKDMGMITALFGVVAMLCGWPMMKIAWFPIVFLICAIPWPELVYSYIASPLQRLAATVAVYVLKASNVEAYHSGTKIIISAKGNTWRTLNVAEACAGLRSLMTFISVAAAIAFLSARPLWQKLIVTASAIPIAIFCNVMRVSGQGLLDHYVSQTWSEGFAHQFAGIVMLVPGFLFILFVGWLLDLVFVEVVDEREERRKRAALVRPTAAPQWSLPGSGLVENGSSAVAPMAKTSVATAAPSPTPVATPVPAAEAQKISAPSPARAPVIARPPVTTTAPGPAATKPAVKPALTRTAIAKPVAASAPGVKPAVSTPLPAIKRAGSPGVTPGSVPKLAFAVPAAVGQSSVNMSPKPVAPKVGVAPSSAVKPTAAPGSTPDPATKPASAVVKPIARPVTKPTTPTIPSPVSEAP